MSACYCPKDNALTLYVDLILRICKSYALVDEERTYSVAPNRNHISKMLESMRGLVYLLEQYLDKNENAVAK